MTGHDLRGFRQSHALTQLQLAEALSVGQARISEWEREIRAIPPYIVKLLNALFDKPDGDKKKQESGG